MAVSRNEHNTKRVTHSLPLTPNWGVTFGELMEAMADIRAEYDETVKAYPGSPSAEAGIHVAPGKDAMVLYFVLEDHK